MTIEEKKAKVALFIETLEKDNKREDGVRRELTNDSAALEAIDSMVDNGEPFPMDCPYPGYMEWREIIEKQIATSEKNLVKFAEQRIEIELYQFYLDNVA